MSKIYENGTLRDGNAKEEAELAMIREDVQQSSKSFLPIEPVPFWRAAFELLDLKKVQVLSALTNQDERYQAELEIEGRKTYRRNDPMVLKLADMLGYPPQQMDALWLHVQENYI